MNRLKIGATAEKQARRFLEQQGLKHIKSNWHCRLGEIDLIMQEQNLLVIVEVRSRNSKQFGGAAASVTASKQRKLIQTTSMFLAKHPKWAQNALRFDVVAYENSDTPNWIQNAFTAEG